MTQSVRHPGGSDRRGPVRTNWLNGIDVANILFAFFGLAVLTLVVVTGESGTDVTGVPDDTWF